MSKATSYYFFDWDDNIMFLDTKILVRNKNTGETREVSTTKYPDVHPNLGKAGEWADYEEFGGTYGNFRDIPAAELAGGQRQHFVDDVDKASSGQTDRGDKWQAPAWPYFKYACEKQRPVSIVTARGHSPETLQAGVQLLVDKGHLPCMPKFHTVIAVTNPGVRTTLQDWAKEGEAPGDNDIPALKRLAIKMSVQKAFDEHGEDADLRFGMSDDDPSNVQLVIQAMAECKIQYPEKRFFVINTHTGQHVKLEVFPLDVSVTGATVLDE